MKAPHLNQRLLILGIFLFSLLSLTLVQFFRLQIIEGSHWLETANKQHVLKLSTPFKRGKFKAHQTFNNHPLRIHTYSQDISKHHLYADPLSIPKEHKETIVHELEGFLGLNQKEVEALKNALNKASRFRQLYRWIKPSTKKEIYQWWRRFQRKNQIPSNALFFVPDHERSYPSSDTLGAILHSVRFVRNEKTKQGLPTGGLEMYFDDMLQGTSGQRYLRRTLKNPMASLIPNLPPEDGADVTLTIHPQIQACAEELLEIGVKRHRAKSGWALMIEPFSGKILCLAQYPKFDPKKYFEYFNDPELIDQARVWAINESFEPGSIIKPITAAIALTANEEELALGRKPLFDPDEPIASDNTSFPGRNKPLKDVYPAKYLNLNLAIQRSSNIYLGRITERIIERKGKEWYREKLSSFGLGQKSHIELPLEAPGMLPTPGKHYPSGAPEWSLSTPYSLCIGYNLLSTSLQVARAFCVFANGGYLIKPSLIEEIKQIEPNGRVFQIYKHPNLDPTTYPKVISNEVAKRTERALEYVSMPWGHISKSSGHIYGFTGVSKSGTAHKIVKGQYSKEHNVGSYIGYMPLSRPQFVLVVSINEAERLYIPGVGYNHSGGTCAAPIYKALSQRALEILGVEEDDPRGKAEQDPNFDPEKAHLLQENEALQEIFKEWNNK